MILLLLVVLSLGFISASLPSSLHLNIQTTSSDGSIITGSFLFTFNISTTSDCLSVVFTNYSNLVTDSRGIVSYYLRDVNLPFNQTYYLCYYRNNLLKSSEEISMSPYSFYSNNSENLGGFNSSYYLNISTPLANTTKMINITQSEIAGGNSSIKESWLTTFFNSLTSTIYNLFSANDTILDNRITIINSTITDSNASWLSTYNSTYNNYAILNQSNSTIWWSNVSSWVQGWFKQSGNSLDFNTSQLSTTYYNASQSSVTAGTIDTGALADTEHSDGKYDGKTFNFSEVSATPGLDLRINFTGIDSFNQGVMRYKTSSGLNGVYPIIQMWNYDTSAWEDYPPLSQSTTFATIEQPVFDNAEHISGGVAQMRIYKATKGNTGNHYYVDWIAIAKGYGTPSGEEVDPYSWHKDTNIEMNGYNITNASYLEITTANVSNDLWVNAINITDFLKLLSANDTAINTTAKLVYEVNKTSNLQGQLNSSYVFQGSSNQTYVSCKNITQDGGTDTDFCTDATGSGGALPIWINDSFQIYNNLSYPSYINLSGILYINKTSGNVGIGTTSPVGALNINTGTGITTTIALMENGEIAFSNQGSATLVPSLLGKSNDNAGLQISSGTNDGNTGGDMLFGVRENDNTDFATTTGIPAFKFRRFATDLVTIQRDGNVGIGTTTPNYALDIYGSGNVYARINSSTGTAGFILNKGTDSQYAGIYFQNGSVNKWWAGLWADNNFSIVDRTNGNTKPFFIETGASSNLLYLKGTNVGIGTTAPGVKLEIDTKLNSAWGEGIRVLDSTLTTGGRNLITLGNTASAAKSGWMSYYYDSVTPANTWIGWGHYGLSEQMVLKYGGNVGIGTTSPAEKLEVNGNAKLSWTGDTYFGWNYTGGGIYRTGMKFLSDTRGLNFFNNMADTAANNYISFTVGSGSGTEIMRITGGNVGIGTTAPIKNLEVRSSATTTAFGLMSGAGNTGLNITGDTSGLITFANQNGNIMQMQLDKDLLINSGSVGINTTNPLGKLQIDTEHNLVGLQINAPKESDFSFGININAGTSINDYGLLVNNASGTNYFIVRGGGNVGIGTTAPAQKLAVVGNISFSDTTTLATGTLSYFTVGSQFILQRTSSNSMFKENILNISKEQVDKIMQLNPVSYQRKGTGQNEFGLIAEEVEKINPDWVVYDIVGGDIIGKDGKITTNMTIIPFSVKYQDIAIATLSKVQELNTKVDTQKIEINSLKLENQDIKKALCEIKPELELC